MSTSDFAATLRDAGLRATQQRLLVMAILAQADDHPNADEVFARAKAKDASISLATIYRTLASLEGVGLVSKLSLENEPARYERTPALEHDHIIDVDSGEVFELANEELNRLRQDLVAQLGFEIVSQHSLIRVRRVGPGRGADQSE